MRGLVEAAFWIAAVAVVLYVGWQVVAALDVQEAQAECAVLPGGCR